MLSSMFQERGLEELCSTGVRYVRLSNGDRERYLLRGGSLGIMASSPSERYLFISNWGLKQFSLSCFFFFFKPVLVYREQIKWGLCFKTFFLLSLGLSGLQGESGNESDGI